MASLKELGLTQKDWEDYIKNIASEHVCDLIEEHWFDDDFPHPVELKNRGI